MTNVRFQSSDLFIFVILPQRASFIAMQKERYQSQLNQNCQATKFKQSCSPNKNSKRQLTNKNIYTLLYLLFLSTLQAKMPFSLLQLHSTRLEKVDCTWAKLHTILFAT